MFFACSVCSSLRLFVFVGSAAHETLIDPELFTKLGHAAV
jgi:hypothetical protein